MEGEAGSINLGRVETTKEQLSSYKEVLAAAWEVLTWKHEWYSIVLVAAVTLVYTLIWWNDITVLTALSLLGITLVCVDVACVHGRGFLSSFLPWDARRERAFADLCVWVAQAREFAGGSYARVAAYRDSSPIVYYVSVSTLLFLLAWIGSSVPNMLLCYWASVGLALAPGVSRNGVVARYASQVFAELQKLLRRYLPVKKPAAVDKEE